MLAFLRRNTIALIALFIALGGTAYAANTVRSPDIVDGQVKTVDLANDSVTGAKTSGFRRYQRVRRELTNSCYGGPAQWRFCADMDFDLPLGHHYLAIVRSTVTGDPGNSTVTAQYCPSREGPTCLVTTPEWVTLWPRGVTTGNSTASVLYLDGGPIHLGTAVRFSGPLLVDQGAHVTSDVEVFDASYESAH